MDGPVLSGGCHCGNLQLRFTPSLPPAQLPVRSCRCAFCVRHGARTASDPAGRVRITVRERRRLLRYRFGLRTADFLVCGQCGVYVAAVLPDRRTPVATVNINVLTDRDLLTRDAVEVGYDDETKAERIARRRARWTPADVMLRARARSPCPRLGRRRR